MNRRAALVLVGALLWLTGCSSGSSPAAADGNDATAPEGGDLDATADGATPDGAASPSDASHPSGDASHPSDAAADAEASCVALDAAAPALPGGKLQATFDARGLAHLAYDGVVLVDLDSSVGDPFGVGSYSLGGTAGSGGTGQTTSWDAASQTVTWSYAWGSVKAAFSVPTGVDTLNVALTVQNTSSQSLDGIVLQPFGVELPALPTGWGASSYPQFHDDLDGPDLVVGDYGSGLLVLANLDAQPLYLGFSPSGAANHYAVLAATLGDTSESFLTTAVPVSRPVAAGQSATYSIALRFGPQGTDYHLLSGDVFAHYAQRGRPPWPGRTAGPSGSSSSATRPARPFPRAAPIRAITTSRPASTSRRRRESPRSSRRRWPTPPTP